MSESGGDRAFDDPIEAHVPREGLPRDYSMRADRHYVEQLAASSSAQPVRMLAVASLDSSYVADAGALRPLLESIRRHGVLQPLLVRRQDSRYSVIAGRKRLLAAITLRLASVPCLVHDVTESEACSLAEADNLRVAAPVTPGSSQGSARTDAAKADARVGGDEALLGALAANAWAELHQGEIKLERRADGGRLTIVTARTV